jgi:uncharacterized membrane protein YiaA
MKYLYFILGWVGLVLICLAEYNNPLTAKTMFYYLLSFQAIIYGMILEIKDVIRKGK